MSDEFMEDLVKYMSEKIEDPATPPETVIPDAIQPYLGWKALSLRGDGRLESPTRSSIWPVKKPFEATCSRQHDFEWQMIRTSNPNPAPEEVTTSFGQGPYGGGGFISASSFATASRMMAGNSMRIEPSEPPAIVPPPGMDWSWEPIEHKVPGEGCSCGIYVVRHASDCQSYMRPDTVLCQIAVWGRVSEGTDGARGQYGYPQQMIAHPKIMDVATLVADLYGVPLRQMTDGLADSFNYFYETILKTPKPKTRKSLSTGFPPYTQSHPAPPAPTLAMVDHQINTMRTEAAFTSFCCAAMAVALLAAMILTKTILIAPLIAICAMVSILSGMHAHQLREKG